MPEWLAFYFTVEGQQIGMLVYLIVVFAITLVNAFTLGRLERDQEPTYTPSVAVLIPARNEEETIRRCIESLFVQEYTDFHIWVLDDLSTDGTAAILAELSAQDSRLTVLSGQPLPSGWLGKPWACHQLAKATDGELMLFVDCDTWHHPAMLRDAVSAIAAEDADLLSVIPDEVTKTLPEKLTVPIITWSLLTHVPIALVKRLSVASLSTAIGQMMLFRREAYQAFGGHAAVQAEVAEDLALARHVTRCGGRVQLLDGVSRVHCRMYQSGAEAWSGLGKNFFAAFGNVWWLYLFVWLWVTLAFLSPYVLLVGWLAGNDAISLTLVLASILLSVVIWGVYVWRLRAPPSLLFLYPAIIASALFLAVHSLVLFWQGSATWKDRRLRSV